MTIENIFLDPSTMGIIAVFLVVFTGYVMAKMNKALGVLWFVVECYIAVQYADLLESEPNYYWHMIILILGGIMVLLPAWMNRR